ncbi:MAG TPA: sulfatase, partial [Dehalococcoidia bacterium]|nr:sulfatase [Dehalococcoidia bacterium]
ESGVLFEVAFAPAPQTGPSHATLFTGWNPWVHRVSNNHSDAGQVAHLPAEFETLAERFKDAGYQTAAITDGAVLRGDFGLTQGFESFDGRYEGVRQKVDRALDFLEHQRDERPLLLFLHTYQVHQPYTAPAEWIAKFDPAYDGILKPVEDLIRDRADRRGEPLKESYAFADSEILFRDRAQFSDRDIEHLRALYDAAIAYTDQELNRLWEYLERNGKLDETLLVITSDHGEEFNEHGYIGHTELYRESLQVPLIVRLPGGPSSPAAGRRVSAPVALVDVHRTLLEATGLGSSPETEGFDLIEGLRQDHFPERPIISATTDHFYPTAEGEPSRLSVRHRNHSMLRYQSGSELSRTLYDYVADPAEAHPL